MTHPSPPLTSALFEYVLRPRRPRFTEALTTVQGLADPAEAWKALDAAGLVPSDWVPDVRRRFLCRRCSGRVASAISRGYNDGEGCARCVEGTTAHPPDIATCVTLASDPDGVARAEVLARDFLEGFGWKGAYVEQVVWRSLPDSGPRFDDHHGWTIFPWRHDRPEWSRGHAHHQWRAVAWIDEHAAGAGFGPPDRFAPLLELWRLGYALDAYSAGSALLYARPYNNELR